jgi:hypothetical protein
MSRVVRGVGVEPDPRVVDRNDPKAMRDYRKRLREFREKERQFRRLPKEEQQKIIEKEGKRTPPRGSRGGRKMINKDPRGRVDRRRRRPVAGDKPDRNRLNERRRARRIAMRRKKRELRKLSTRK